jgi:UDP-N-acetylmuramate dehydrogenase
VETNRLLADLTTIGIGGPARYFTEARSEADIAEALSWAAERGAEVFFLGGGSNILVSDSGFDGLVVKMALNGIEFKPETEKTILVTAAAGVEWDALVKICVERGLSGIECLSGIPGTVGGTPIQNVGAYGQEVSQTIVSVRCLERHSLRSVVLSNEDCGFSYRSSIFNNGEKGNYVVLSVVYRLDRAAPQMPEYPELRREIGNTEPEHLTAKAVRDAVLRIRRKKSMVVDRSDPNSKSLGSFFKNPVVTLQEYESVKDRFGNVPSFAAEGGVKIPAAWLIENAGFEKGTIAGNVGISRNHSLALINRGGASAAELIEFRNHIADAVESRFGIRLQMEPEMVGVF